MNNVSANATVTAAREAERETQETGKLVTPDEVSQRLFHGKIREFLAGVDAQVKRMEEDEKNGVVNPAALAAYESEKREAEFRFKKLCLDCHKIAGVPLRYVEHAASIQHWEPENEYQASAREKLLTWMAELAAGSRISMALWGNHGTGKSHLACGVIRDRADAGLASRYITAKAYTGMIRESYRNDSPEPESAILARYSTVPLLVLDEIGREFGAETEKLYLFELINERYNRCLPTLFVTNMACSKEQPEFQDFLGDAIMERLREGGGRFLRLNWKSRRTPGETA